MKPFVIAGVVTPIVVVLSALACATVAHAASARGFIVELRDAPAHAAASREAAQHAGRVVDAAAVQRERLQRVVAAAGLASVAGAPAAMRPQGRAAHVIEFGRALSSAEVADMLARLRAAPEVAWAEPNEREPLLQATTPSDPLFPGSSGQWWLHPAGGSDQAAREYRLRGVPGVQRAWTLSTGTALVPVAVLDTGATAHPELQGVWLPGIDLVSDGAMANDGDGRDLDPGDPGDWVSASDHANVALSDCEVHDSSWHGTVVAGLIGARTDNNEGVAAVGWNARVVPVRVAGKCGAEVADLIDGMRWAAGLTVSDGLGWLPLNANPVRVINISFGSARPCSSAYQSAIAELRQMGVLVVAAAGNGQGAVMRPANCRGVLAVAALNRDGFKAYYSSFGSEVAVATVGGDDADGAGGLLLADGGLLSLYNWGTMAPQQAGYARHFGTSFAAPIVAGTAALMLAVNPGLSADQLVAGLTVTARPHVLSPWLTACSSAQPARCLCTAATCGAGMLDAEQALLYARDPAAYVPPNRSAEVLDNADLAATAGIAEQPTAQPAADVPADAGGGALGWPWLAVLAAALGALQRRTAPAARSWRATVKAASRRA